MKGLIIPYYPFPTLPPAEGYVNPWLSWPSPYAGNPMPNADIANLVALAQAYPHVPIVVAANGGDNGFYAHNSGTNFDSQFNEAINRIRAAGIKFCGYVYTYSGNRTLAQVKADIDHWFSLYPQIDGIFLDEYAAAAGGLSWYTSLCQYLRTKTNFIIGNGGVPSISWYSALPNAPDIIMIESWATDANASLGGIIGSASRNSFLPHANYAGVPSDPAAIFDNTTLQHMYTYVDWLYCADMGADTNPADIYQYLSSYLDRQIAVASALNGYPDPVAPPYLTIFNKTATGFDATISSFDQGWVLYKDGAPFAVSSNIILNPTGDGSIDIRRDETGLINLEGT